MRKNKEVPTNFVEEHKALDYQVVATICTSDFIMNEWMYFSLYIVIISFLHI